MTDSGRLREALASSTTSDWESGYSTSLMEAIDASREGIDATPAVSGSVPISMQGLRIGTGYDVHALVPGRKLILGGVEVPHDRGLLGHSDADVIAHAISDALLGAVRAGDIGKLFPDTDPAYKDADSLKLLSAVADLVRSEGFEILDVDSVIAAQAPKISPYRDRMRENLARAMSLELESVGLKATTTEHLGFEGREEGISATAVCLLCRCSTSSST